MSICIPPITEVLGATVSGIDLSDGIDAADLAALIDAYEQLSSARQHGLEGLIVERDIVIWDNRATLHRATPYDGTRYRRLMQRATVSSGTAAELQAMEAQQ